MFVKDCLCCVNDDGNNPKPGKFNRRTSKPRARQQKADSLRSRKRKHCVFPECSGEVVNLKRHIRQVHKDIPEFEIPSILDKIKPKPKRKWYVYECSEQSCDWKGTRPEKHLHSKHGYEKHHALILAKQIKLHAGASSKTVRKPDFHSAESLSEEFLTWYQSIEGGNYIPFFLDEQYDLYCIYFFLYCADLPGVPFFFLCGICPAKVSMSHTAEIL